MTKRDLNNKYFCWMLSLISSPSTRQSSIKEYSKLLCQLNEIPFRYCINLDSNRECDGIDLRYRFGYEKNYDQRLIATYLDDKPCSVLEMMIALAIRCEEHIVSNAEIGDRTAEWLWDMIENLGLLEFSGDYTVSEEESVDCIIEQFLDRDYSKDGNGSLFFIPNCPYNMKRAEIWYQMQWYLDYKLNQ